MHLYEITRNILCSLLEGGIKPLFKKKKCFQINENWLCKRMTHFILLSWFPINYFLAWKESMNT